MFDKNWTNLVHELEYLVRVSILRLSGTYRGCNKSISTTSTASTYSESRILVRTLSISILRRQGLCNSKGNRYVQDENKHTSRGVINMFCNLGATV